MEQYSKRKVLKTEAYILKAFPFKDNDLIVSLFSLEFGLIKGVIAGARSKRKGLLAYLSPASKVELIFKESGRELKSFSEVSPLAHTEKLRKNLQQIGALYAIVDHTLKALALEKPSQTLYLLFEKILEELKVSEFPEKLATAYTLKLLNYEGHLSENLFREEDTLEFSESEIKALFSLTLTKNFSRLNEIPLEIETTEKVRKLFTLIYL